MSSTMASIAALTVLICYCCSYCHAHITYIEARSPLLYDPPPPGTAWPLPQYISRRNKQFEVEPDEFFFLPNSNDCDIIKKAQIRYRFLMFGKDRTSSLPTGLPRLSGLQIIVKNSSDCLYPYHGMVEKYELIVFENGTASLRAETPWGILRGLETFSQIVYKDEATNAFLVNETLITDFPRFEFRGVMLDTARHFLPIKTLKQNLDAMSYNKFNVFHWHIVDDQSWPLQLKTFPNLTGAAYHPRLVYTLEETKDLIEYARLRGIRIIPEIDTPGHSQAIGKIFPDLLTNCYGDNGRGTPSYPKFAGREMLNPMRSYTYDTIKNILREVIELFPDDYIHLGMDEVYYDCWASSPEIEAFMVRHNMTTISEVEQYYVRRTLANVKNMGAKYMIWQDPIDNGVKAAPDTIIGLWRNNNPYSWESYLQDAVRHGYQIVISQPWYLNYISYGQDWQKYYEVEPLAFRATPAEKKLIIGGEACLWSEYVDATNAMPRLWPRASAVAERLWSDKNVNDAERAKYRLDEQRCRMLRRGIPAQPILNGYCGSYEWGLD